MFKLKRWMKRSPRRRMPPRFWEKAFSRRIALKAALAIPLSARAAQGTASASSERELLDLVKKTETQAQAFIRGDMDKWFSMLHIAGDFTLMQPFGGTTRGFDSSPERLARMASYFRNGDAKLELVQSYASDDLVVLAMIERQHGEVGGLPSQDWSLRVTQVYRRQGEQWWLVHRHADPLVRYVGLEPAAALARGANLDKRG
ncbi:MAG: nuclear transport factor 2 family protein [Tardiphaga sp.]